MTGWWLVLLVVLLAACLTLFRRLATAKREYRSLKERASRDELTGLETRSGLVEELTRLLAASGDRVVSVLYLDLDGFKPVNDSFGHAAGDAVLIEVTSRLRATLREAGVIGRLGGDEFGILRADASVEPPEELARRLVQAVGEPYRIAATDVIVTVSIGIANSTTDVSAEELLRNADLAMYAAKARGKSTWATYEPPMRARLTDTFGMEAELRKALLDVTSEFDVAYQPLLDLTKDRPVAAEALARWRTGAVGPSEFVPVAERTTLIYELGRQVLRQACLSAVAWNKNGARHAVWVNVARGQLVTPAFRRQVDEVLCDSGLDPELLMLEVNESAWIDADSLIEPLRALRDLGVGLAIDDFGAGVSSITPIWRSPICAVKIDKTLIAGIGVNRPDEIVIESVIRLSHDLGRIVAAEGVETTAQLDFLRSAGCHLVQGFVVAAPMDAEAAGTFLGLEPSP